MGDRVGVCLEGVGFFGRRRDRRLSFRFIYYFFYIWGLSYRYEYVMGNFSIFFFS